jgi:hypothetical protein
VGERYDEPSIHQRGSKADCGILLIRRNQPYIDWANSFEDGGPTYDPESNHTSAYLIPPFEQPEKVDEFIAANFGAIFEEELSSWMEASATWPEFSLDNFRKWFSVEYIDMVYDLISQE